jgi:hypothetical protein
MIQTSRRTLLTSLISFMASPAIVRAASLMPVKPMVSAEDLLHQRLSACIDEVLQHISDSLYGAAGPTGVWSDLSLAATKITFDGGYPALTKITREAFYKAT